MKQESITIISKRMESGYHNHHRNLYSVDCVWCSNFRQKKENINKKKGLDK